jgi:hypothetical protein
MGMSLLWGSEYAAAEWLEVIKEEDSIQLAFNKKI